MQCPRCRVENKPERRFCSACGQALATPCPRCGFVNEPADRFCGGCGRDLAAATPADLRSTAPQSYTPPHLAEKILTSRSALEGERKQVSVLFADVSGFTSLSERLDPEDVHRLMIRAFELMLAEVHRYEGTVNQFLGDGIMALFGAPIAHEDHAQRAVHAALGIRKALEGFQDELHQGRGVRFQMRQGLNTGLVVVGGIGSDLRMDYTAVGDTTNVAARLQQAAEPGRILVSEATHRLVAGHFHARPLGELPLKGKAEPVGAWEVIGARRPRSRLEVEAEHGLTPFVGRGRELRVLLESFGKVKAGQGQVVFVAGEPGIGKSRLLYELRQRLADEASWVEGHCLSFGRAIAFHPLIELLRRTFGVDEGDAEAVSGPKIERAVLRLGEDLRPTLPWLRYLLSLDPGDPAVLTTDPRLRRVEVFEAVRRLLLRAAEIRPQVVVYEDVHWMDKATEEYVALMADSIAAAPVLMILTYRPGYLQPFGDRTYYTRLALTTLSTEESVRMTEAMLETAELPPDLQALVARKAEGNPFFVEEVVKSLQEIGALRLDDGRYVLAKRLEEVFVPDTIQDVIMARIDRLDDAPKKTLQLASVIGREFTRRLLDRLAEIRESTEGYLRELKAIELIYEKSLFPELAYMFKHALTHEVAYNSLLRERRKELHQLIGLAIEELYAERLPEQYEVLAHHFSKAEAWPKALAYLIKAAEKAGRAFAIREALALYDQALEVARPLGDAVPPATLMAIHQAKSNQYFAIGEYEASRAEGERWRDLARRAGDRAAEAGALAWTSFATTWAQDFDGGLAYAGQAIEIASAVGARSALAGGYLTTGYIHALTARHDEAKVELGQAVTIGRTAGDVVRQALALVMLGVMRNWKGAYREGAEFTAEGIRISREHNLLIPLLRNLWGHGVILTGLGDYDGALAVFEEGLALAEKVGDAAYIPRYLNSLGWLHGECEDLEGAIRLAARGGEDARRWRHAVGIEMTAYSETNRGDALLAKGDLDSAREAFEEVHGLVRNPATHPWMKWRYTIHLYTSLGELGLARGDPAVAGDCADRALEIAVPTESRKYLVRAWRLKGEAATFRRQWDEAEQALGQALTLAQAIGTPPQLWKTHAALGRLHAEAKRPDAARHAYRSAREVIDRIRTGMRHPGLRAALETAPAVRRIVAAGAE